MGKKFKRIEDRVDAAEKKRRMRADKLVRISATWPKIEPRPRAGKAVPADIATRTENRRVLKKVREL